jgi:hypothetical protein
MPQDNEGKSGDLPLATPVPATAVRMWRSPDPDEIGNLSSERHWLEATSPEDVSPGFICDPKKS